MRSLDAGTRQELSDLSMHGGCGEQLPNQKLQIELLPVYSSCPSTALARLQLLPVYSSCPSTALARLQLLPSTLVFCIITAKAQIQSDYSCCTYFLALT
jgi:hypothetical protein